MLQANSTPTYLPMRTKNVFRAYFCALHLRMRGPWAGADICLIDKPTRFTPSSATLLDHVCTNIYSRAVTADILLYDISDYLPTMCSLMLKRKKSRVQRKMYRSMANYRKDDFLDEITSLSNRLLTDLSLHPTAFHVDNICTKFINEFSFIVNTRAPLKQMSKTKSNQKFKPWLTKGILKSIKTKNKLYPKCYKQNNLTLKRLCGSLATRADFLLPFLFDCLSFQRVTTSILLVSNLLPFYIPTFKIFPTLKKLLRF